MKAVKKFFVMLMCLCMLQLPAEVLSPVKTVEAATTTGWVKVGTGYKWMQADGTYYTRNGWATLGGKQYYIKKDGTMKTGWMTSQGYRYFLSQSSDLSRRGTKVSGKVTIGGRKYYFSTGASTLGRQKTGVLTLSGKKYWFDPEDDGAMQINRWKDNMYFGADGAAYKAAANAGVVVKTIGDKKYVFGSDSTLLKKGVYVRKDTEDFYYVNSTGTYSSSKSSALRKAAEYGADYIILRDLLSSYGCTPVQAKFGSSCFSDYSTGFSGEKDYEYIFGNFRIYTCKGKDKSGKSKEIFFFAEPNKEKGEDRYENQ